LHNTKKNIYICIIAADKMCDKALPVDNNARASE
jgi:hypothetical protein